MSGPTWDDVERDFGHYQHTHKDFGPEEYGPSEEVDPELVDHLTGYGEGAEFGPEEYVEPEPDGKLLGVGAAQAACMWGQFGPEDYGPDDLGELVEAKPPDGWRWATAEESEMYQRFGVPGMLVVPLTDDETGEQYTQQEADLAVPDGEG